MNEKTIRAGLVAKRLRNHPNTVRSWSDQYQDYLSTGATGKSREYTESDVQVLATVRDMRSKGFNHAEIAAALKAGQLIDDVPEIETPEVEHARQQVSLVPMAQLERAFDQIKLLQVEIDRIREERDKAQIDKDKANEKIQHLEHELGIAKGRVQNIIFSIIAVIIAVVITVVIALVLVGAGR